MNGDRRLLIQFCEALGDLHRDYRARFGLAQDAALRLALAEIREALVCMEAEGITDLEEALSRTSFAAARAGDLSWAEVLQGAGLWP